MSTMIVNTISEFPIVLQIKSKENLYLRFIYSDPQEAQFIESYVNWSDWIKFEKEFLEYKLAADQCIKRKQITALNETFSAMRHLLDKFFKKSGLPFNSKIPLKVKRRLNVHWGADDLFLPLELYFPGYLIKNLLPSKTQSPETGKLFTLIYSHKLESAPKEVSEIKSIIANHFPHESFSEDSYQDYKSNLSESKIFHFSGHGKLDGKKGQIILGEKAVDELMFHHGLELAFLHVCLAGTYPRGIVQSLIQEGTKFVIASPYEIEDDYNISGFYRQIIRNNIESAYLAHSFQEPEFPVLYRLFGSYKDKI